MPSSFKRSTNLGPARYRTPSPPRYAFEPISPFLTGISADEVLCAESAGHRNGLKRPYLLYDNSNVDAREQFRSPEGAMDAFASIALATTSGGHCQPSTATGAQFIDDEYKSTDRPSKRARSEKLSMLDWSRTAAGLDTTAAASLEPSPESRRLEAELLLNFAHEAAKLVCSPKESSQLSAQLSLSGSRPSQNFSPASTIEGSRERGRNFTGGNACNFAENKVIELQMLSHGVRAIDTNRLPSEADPWHETDPDQRMPDNAASDCLDATVGHHAVKTQHGSSGITRQQIDLESPTEDSEKDAGDRRTETFDRCRAGGIAGNLGVAVVHETQSGMEAELQNNAFDTEVKEESHSSISSKERYLRKNLKLGGATWPMGNVVRTLDDDVEVSKGQNTVQSSRYEDSEVHGAPREPQEKLENNESRTIHGALGNQARTVDGNMAAEADVSKQSTPEVTEFPVSASNVSSAAGQPRPAIATAAICASCKFGRNSSAIENDNNATSWISCDGCKSWFHFACAGFKNDREVRAVDKYRCRKCKPLYGATTYVRKSSRAHSAIDYAGLHQGVIKTSDERPEHHYIKPIKDGTITFLPECFARMRPELVTTEFFEKGTGMKEPIVIPACFNPRPRTSETPNSAADKQPEGASSPIPLEDNDVSEDWFSRPTEPEAVLDQGQDALDMVVPQGLTVRQVAELYGQDEKVEVIDVKSQNGENRKWNMRRWADYYENPNNKVVRNVISLEVSQSKLGRLIRRPQIVRDLDLQDSVWPEELLAKGEYPRVQFYCLMSVADCFTDFHIDFGGSSVFYHILKGKKTFLFIPPKEKYLKKYEEWCMSPAQNWTFLGDQTKECYRVDLSEGDTMLIPAGWIHAVWTPEDSLVIGGNFLTRLNFGMQLRVAQVEKATGVARKFRYPHFQKLHWYTALRYLEDDPLPGKVKESLHAGGTFMRQQPAHYEFDSWGENSRPGVENYHTRYYSQPELDGLPDLTRYLLRTALIDIGSITDGISAETRNAVKKSIPRGHGEPLDVLKTFAAWCAWKRGNEPIPHWAYPDAEPETLAPDKLSAAAMKKLDREAALQAPRRQSARMQSQQAASEVLRDSPGGAGPSVMHSEKDAKHNSTPKKPKLLFGGTNGTSHRKTACESCRRRRRACKHKEQVALSMPSAQIDPLGSVLTDLSTALHSSPWSLGPGSNDGQDSNNSAAANSRTLDSDDGDLNPVPEVFLTAPFKDTLSHQPDDLASQSNSSAETAVSGFAKVEESMHAASDAGLELVSGNATLARPRHKACNECRKSKVSTVSAILIRSSLTHSQRRCIHDEYGNEDPIKVRESAIPRPHARKSNTQSKEASTPKKYLQGAAHKRNAYQQQQPAPTISIFEEQISRPAPIANMIAPPANSVIQRSEVPGLTDHVPLASPGEPIHLDPALFDDSANNVQHEELTSTSVTHQQSVGPSVASPHEYMKEFSNKVADQWQTTDSCPAPHIEIGATTIEPRGSFEPPASSLVSPPASLHDDAGVSPVDAHAGWKSSSLSSRHSSSQPKQMQRYTPDSGSMRRASSSSYDENTLENAVLPVMADVSSDQKAKARNGSQNTADEESMRLIKELQAEEYGLRRRA